MQDDLSNPEMCHLYLLTLVLLSALCIHSHVFLHRQPCLPPSTSPHSLPFPINPPCQIPLLARP
ncbi:hypothetical protein BDR03DRAFT_974170 [Suillus americanus]|nr:hypothetical protein BDR03DRAFT_974170 [Suillus americanus]